MLDIFLNISYDNDIKNIDILFILEIDSHVKLNIDRIKEIIGILLILETYRHIDNQYQYNDLINNDNKRENKIKNEDNPKSKEGIRIIPQIDKKQNMSGYV